jgi:DNA end-binding protein Ku
LLYGREYLVAIKPQKNGFVMYTLHHDAEVRGIEQVDELNSLPTTVKPEALKLAKQVVSTFDAEPNLKDYKDDYSDALRAIIESKIAGQEVITPAFVSPVPVADLMDALRKSLGAVAGTKKKPAKADLRAVKPKAVGSRKRRAS